jgi:hypothetical protein
MVFLVKVASVGPALSRLHLPIPVPKPVCKRSPKHLDVNDDCRAEHPAEELESVELTSFHKSTRQRGVDGVEAALRRIDLARQSLYQQFQLVQELRRNGLGQRDSRTPPAYGVAPAPGNHADLQRERKQRQQRAKALAQELDRLYQRYQELEDQKRPLLERMRELAR